MNNAYFWSFQMTPKERQMAREMGKRFYHEPTWKERLLAWFYQWIP